MGVSRSCSPPLSLPDLRRLLTACVLLLAAGESACASDLAAEFFEELRARGLFRVAEAHCLERLSSPTISPDLRAELAVELSRTFLEHARFSSGREQQEFWDRAQSVVDDVLTAEADHPRRPFLELQRSFVPGSRGEFLRWQLELFPYDDALRQEALKSLGECVQRLTALERTLVPRYERAVRSARGNTREPLTGRELKDLLFRLRFELGAALTAQASLHPAASAERSAALARAAEYLHPIADGAWDQDLAWKSRIRLAEIYRLEGDVRRSAAELAGVEKENPPLDILNGAVAERVRLMLQAGQPDAAAQLLSRYRGLYRSMPGPLWFLDVRSLLAMWKIAAGENDHVLAGDLLRRVEETVGRAEREAGGHWGYRCRQLLEQAREADQYGPELADLVRRAKAAYANGRLDDAMAEYDRAARQARDSGQSDVAFELLYTKTSIQLHAGQTEAAGEEFRRLADEFPQAERAPLAHLLWAWCLGRLYDENRTESARLKYVEALSLHRQRFADHPTAHDAAWMLGVLEERRLQSTAALKLYYDIPADHPRGPDAHLGVARCYETIIERLRDHVRQAEPSRRDLHQRRLADWEQDAIDRLEAIIGPYVSGAQPLDPPQAELCLRLARIRLNSPRPDYAAADRLLERIFERWSQVQSDRQERTRDAPPAEPAWGPILNTATQLRIVSLAGQQEIEQARQFMQSLSEADPAEALAVLDGLTQVVADADESVRQDLGELQLDAAESLSARREELQPHERLRLDHCLAQAYVATRQPKRAIEIFEQLLATAPRDKQLLKTVAKLLMNDCGTPECLRKAKEHWRTLESFESPGSQPWLRARLNVARACFELREFEECRKLLAVTKLLYPTLGGDELRDQFGELERRVLSLVAG